MKFAMNGSLTIGTMDGANIELRQEIGAENFFDFGLTTDELESLRTAGYRPREICEADAELADVFRLIESGYFSRGDSRLFATLTDGLLDHDPYFVIADFRAYADCQARVGEAYLRPRDWARMALLNTARSGKFSSDRTISEYYKEIWRVDPVPIDV